MAKMSPTVLAMAIIGAIMLGMVLVVSQEVLQSLAGSIQTGSFILISTRLVRYE